MFQVIQKELDFGNAMIPKVWIQVIKLNPSSSIFVWGSNVSTCPAGDLALSMPGKSDVVTTKLTGAGSIDDLSTQMSRILSKNFKLKSTLA